MVERVLQERKEELLMLRGDITPLYDIKPLSSGCGIRKRSAPARSRLYGVGRDLGTAEERALTAGERSVFITNFPKSARPST